MAQSRTDQHQGRVPIRERPHHTRPAADLTVQSFDHIVCSDASPMLTWEVAVGQCFLNTVLHFLRCFFQLHRFQLGNYGLCFFTRGIFTLLCMDRLKHFRHNFDLGFGNN